MAPHSSTLAWKIPWMEEPGGLQSMGSLRVGHDWTTSLSLFTFMHWRRKWQPTPVFLPGESQRWGAWWAAIYGSHRVGHDWSHLQQQRMGLDAWSSFFECWVLCQLFHSPLSLSSRGFDESLFAFCHKAYVDMLSAYLRLLVFFLAILISACDLSSPAFFMMYSAYKLNKQSDSLFVLLSEFWTSLLFHIRFCFTPGFSILWLEM